MQVTDPAGETWRVKRRWLPWRLRRRNPEDVTDFPDVSDVGDDLLIGLAIFVIAILVAVFFPIVIVLAVFAAEFFLLLLLLPVFVILRAGFVARWPIEVWRGERLQYVEAVRGWGESHRRMLAMVDGIRLGDPPRSARRHRAADDAD